MLKNKKKPCKSLTYRAFKFAERKGFDPSIPFRGIHTFQACSFNHSDTSLYCGCKEKDNFQALQVFKPKSIAFLDRNFTAQVTAQHAFAFFQRQLLP